MAKHNMFDNYDVVQPDQEIEEKELPIPPEPIDPPPQNYLTRIGMFDNYNATEPGKPTNIPQPVIPVAPERIPYEEYAVDGEVIGYYWYAGDTVEIKIEFDGEVTIENDSLLYIDKDSGPTSTTYAAHIGQLAYNITDKRKWKCIFIDNGTYQWEEIDYDLPENANKDSYRTCYITATNFLADKVIKVQLWDNLHQTIRDADGNMLPHTEQVFDSGENVRFVVDSELSQRLLPDIYYLSVQAFNHNDDLVYTIVPQEKCRITIK